MEKGISRLIARPSEWGRATATRAAGLLLLLGAGLIIVTVALPPAARGSDLLILGYGAVSGIAGALLLRRPRVSEPVLGLAAALGTAVITLSTLEAGSGVGAEDNQVLYLWVCVFSFWFLSTRHALLQVGLIGAADAVLLLDEGPTLAAGVTRWLVIVTTFVTIGLLIAWVRRALDRQRAETARLAAVAERIRIARELQDATGAGVAAVSVQATAGLSAIDRDPEATRRALEEIARTAKTTLQDMRRLLGVLRPEDPGDAFDRVSLTGIDELVAECRRAGIPVEVGISGEPIQLPEALDQAAYRIAQEALTNVLRHGGPDAMARLRLGYDAEGVSIEVTNKGRPAAEAGAESGGKGLAGMRERVEMFGGALETGPLEGGGFRVHARLPVRAPVANA